MLFTLNLFLKKSGLGYYAMLILFWVKNLLVFALSI